MTLEIILRRPVWSGRRALSSEKAAIDRHHVVERNVRRFKDGSHPN
jgi:hypothetical protein